MNLKENLKEIVKHSSIYMLGLVISSALRLGLLPVFTRYLNQSEYGTLALLDSAIELIRILCALGIGSAIVRFFHEQQDIDHQRRVMATGLTFLLLLVFASGLLILPFSKPITSLILGESGRLLFFQLAFFTVLLGLLRSGADSYLTVNKRSKTYIIINTSHSILNAFLNLYLVVFHEMGVLGVLTGNLIIATIINGGMFIYAVRKNGFLLDKELLFGMMRFGLPLVPSIWAASAMHNLDRFFIRKYASLEEVGLYSLAYQFPFMLNALFMDSFERIWSASSIYNIARSSNASYQFARICTYYMTFVTFALFAISVASDIIISIFAAPSYFAAHQYLPVISLGVWGYVLHIFIRVGVNLTKKTYLFAINYSLAFVCNLILNFVFVPYWGAMGAAWATVGTYFWFSLGGYLIYRHCYPIKLEWVRLVKLLSLGIFLVVCRQLVPASSFLSTLLTEIIFIAIFPIIVLIVPGFLTLGERRVIKGWCLSSLKLS